MRFLFVERLLRVACAASVKPHRWAASDGHQGHCLEDVALPQAPRGFLGVRRDRRCCVEDPGQTPLGVVRGPARVARGGEGRPCRAHLGRQDAGVGGVLGADGDRAEVGVVGAEQQRAVEAVAGAQQSALARGLPGQDAVLEAIARFGKSGR